MLAQPQSAAPILEWKSDLDWKSGLDWKPTRDPRKTNPAAVPLEARFHEAVA